jgi:hypothetical protein
VGLNLGPRLSAKAQKGFLNDVLAAVVVVEQTTNVGQQRSLEPPGRRDHPVVVLPHAASSASGRSTAEPGVS